MDTEEVSGKRKSAKQSWDIPIRRINSNTNPRNPLSSSLQAKGWDCMVGNKQIWKLATSDDASERAEYVKLIKEHDQEIASLAATILAEGLLEPVEVREGGTGTFTLVFGARRCLAVLYNWCLLGKPKEPLIWAQLCKGNACQLLHRAVIENIRKPQSFIDEAKAIRSAINNGESTEEVAAQLGMSASTVDSRLKLLELDPKEQKAIHEGRKTVSGIKKEKAEANGRTVIKLRSKKEIMAAVEEFREDSPQGRLFAWLLCKTEKIG